MSTIEIKPINALCTSKFTVTKSTKIMVGELSELEINRHTSIEHRLYYDALDVGITLVSHKTGEFTTWYMDHDIKDHEGELVGTVYKPTPETKLKCPQLDGWEVHVLFD